jgi:hypothetical protein
MNKYTSKPYTVEEINRICDLYKNGTSLKNVAIMVKRKRDNVKKILIENNLWFKKKIKPTDEQLIKILYVDNKYSLDKVANQTEYSKMQIKSFLKKQNLIRGGTSNGIKINLTDDQKDLIKKLYLIDKKNCEEISELTGLNKNYINKHLSNSNYRRTKSEAISLRQKGKKRSMEVVKKLTEAQRRLAKSGNRKQTGGYCKFYYINGLKCQGTYEKHYIELIVKNNGLLPDEGDNILTPFGIYYSDFKLNNELIEIKSDYTYDILIGLKPNRFTKKIDTNQYDKIKWVNENIMPVNIIVVDKKNNKLIKKIIL